MMTSEQRLKAAVHWVRVNALSAESSPKLTCDAMGLRADSARTDSRSAESARNPISSHVKFGDDSAPSAFTRTQWTAAFRSTPITPNELRRMTAVSTGPPAVTDAGLTRETRWWQNHCKRRSYRRKTIAPRKRHFFV